MSHVRTSSALGARPRLYVDICASAVPPATLAESTIPASNRLRKQRIVYPPISSHFPGMNGIEVIDPGLCGFEKARLHAPHLGDIGERWLNAAPFIRRAGQDYRFFS